jgi:O-6-methylguanine DNA methyltransferase
MGNRRHGRISFADRVYALCRKIPKGRISTYKIIGRKLGRRGQIYRAVGVALNKNKSKSVPCHRVVNSTGEVGGFARGTNAKIKLLKKEGIKIKNKRITDFEKRLFKF